MIVYYVNKVSEKLKDCHYPITEGDICMLYDGEVVKTIFIDNEVDSDSIWRDFKFIDTKSLRNYLFPKSDRILCAPTGQKHSIGDTVLLTQLIKECKGEWLLDFLNETSAILSGFVDYWDLNILRRLIGDDDIKIAYGDEKVLGEYIDGPDEINVDRFDDENDESDVDFTSQNHYIKQFCLLALACIEGKLDRCSYQILYDTLNGISRSEIASNFNLTQERVRQIVVDATKQAKNLLIEQHKNLEETKAENVKLKDQLNLLREEVAGFKLALSKDKSVCKSDDRDKVSYDEETLPSIIPEKDFGNENRNGKPWTANEEELISLYFEQGQSFSSIAALVGRTENSIKARLAKLGLIEYTYGQDENNNETLKNVEIDYTQGYRIEIKGNRSLIIDKFGKKVFSTSGKLKIIGEDIYRICYTYSSISMNIIRKNERDMFVLGWRILNAHHRTPLYAALDEQRYLEQINSVIYNEEYDEYYVQVDSRLYGSSGYFADLGQEDAVTQRKERTEEQKPSNTSNEDNTIQEETKVDKRIGCVVRLFPSQKKERL